MKTRTAAFAGYSLVLAFLFLDHLKQLYFFSSDHTHYTHFALVPFLALYSLYLDRSRRVPESPLTSVGDSAGSSMTLLIAGIMSYVASQIWGGQLDLNDRYSWIMASFLVLFLAGATLCYGTRRVKAAAFPIGLLLFMVPIPTVILERLLYALQLGSAWMASLLFNFTGVPFFRENLLVFSLPGLVIEVAEECSGIRSSLALLICGILVAHFYLQGRWQRVILIASIFPLSIFKNGVRIVTISLLSIYVDEGFINGALHRRAGIVFFLMSLGLLLMLLWVLRTKRVQELSEGFA